MVPAMVSRLRGAWPPGVRAQLTLLYTLIFAALFVLSGAVLYNALQRTLAESFDRALQVRAAALADGISNSNGTICIQDVTGTLPGVLEQQSTCGGTGGDGELPGGTSPPPSSRSNVTISTLVRVLSAKGQVVYATPAFRQLSLPPASAAQPLSGTAWSGTVTAPGGDMVRVYSVPLIDNGMVYGVVQVGESLAPLLETLRSITLALFLIAPFALVLGAVGSYLLAARALRPVRRLTRTARAIEASDLSQRVPVPRAGDEVRELALTLNAMIARLDAAFAQQRRFVADASHELRTPVAVIRGTAEVALAQANLSPGELAAALGDIAAEAERLGALLGELLTLARADEAQMRLDREPVRLDLLAADAVASLEPLAAERQVRMSTTQLEPATVLGDTAWLIQVILNLLTNALSYTPAGGTVTVSVTTSGTQAHLIVRDTGIGIARVDLARIFERFYRADKARAQQSGGSGLGLAIVDWVVRAHEGTVAVESRVAHGSRFTVTLPLAD